MEQPGLASAASGLRVVVDAQIALSLFIQSREFPGRRSSRRLLLRLLGLDSFRWLWSYDMIDDYRRGADAIEANQKLMARAVFNRIDFELFLAALCLFPPVDVSATSLRKARGRIDQAPRVGERDLDDAIYLACAVDGNARLITSEDTDLRSLGREYEGVLILSWLEFLEYLRNRGTE
jgi:predicted nucleic acid-binding protein